LGPRGGPHAITRVKEKEKRALSLIAEQAKREREPNVRDRQALFYCLEEKVTIDDLGLFGGGHRRKKKKEISP